jgi:hypothetical protein
MESLFDQELTDELVLAITTNAPALSSYFDSSP